MKKVNKIFNTVTISLLILIGIGICGTYLSDYLTSINWFGDHIELRNHSFSDRTYDYEVWGARHYWYNWGVGLLFCTALARAVAKIIYIIEE